MFHATPTHLASTILCCLASFISWFFFFFRLFLCFFPLRICGERRHYSCGYSAVFLWSQQDSCSWIWFHPKNLLHEWGMPASSVYLWLVYHFREIHGTFKLSEICRDHGYVHSRFFWLWVSLKYVPGYTVLHIHLYTCMGMLSSNTSCFKLLSFLLHTCLFAFSFMYVLVTFPLSVHHDTLGSISECLHYHCMLKGFYSNHAGCLISPQVVGIGML